MSGGSAAGELTPCRGGPPTPCRRPRRLSRAARRGLVQRRISPAHTPGHLAPQGPYCPGLVLAAPHQLRVQRRIARVAHRCHGILVRHEPRQLTGGDVGPGVLLPKSLDRCQTPPWRSSCGAAWHSSESSRPVARVPSNVVGPATTYKQSGILLVGCGHGRGQVPSPTVGTSRQHRRGRRLCRISTRAAAP